MTLTSRLASTKTKITLWILLGVGIIGLGIVLFALFGTNQSASFSLQQPTGTCYQFDPNQGRPPLPGLTYPDCQKQAYWSQFCFKKQTKGDSGCYLRAVEEGQGQTGPDHDKLADNTRGNCQLETPENLVIKDITYAECRTNKNWIFFAYGRRSQAFRRGQTTIKYKKGQARLDDTNVNCVKNPNKPTDTRGNICTNSQQWCAYDDPTFCVKR